MLATAIATETSHDNKHGVDRVSSGNLHRVKRVDDPDFGKRFKKAFGDAKNYRIAAQMGISDAAVKNYVDGRVPGPEALLKIHQLTGCNLHWLLTGEGSRRVEDHGDVFDLEYVVEESENWLDVIDQWYASEGKTNPMPDTLGASFMGGWASFTKEQRLNAIRDFKNFLDLTFPNGKEAE